MKRSSTRILTTHTGSLPRPQSMLDLLMSDQDGDLSDRSSLQKSVHESVADVVKLQVNSGLDIINDGEQGRVDYTVFVKDLLTGFEGESTAPIGAGDDEFPELAELLRPFASPFQTRPACVGPVGWKDFASIEEDIANLKAATIGIEAEEVFMTSPSPGQISRFLHNQYYASDEEYLYALGDVMKKAYTAIVDAGFLLQLDCPDLALSRHTVFADLSLEDFRKQIQMHVEALNHAVADIDPENMRMHLCWGSTLGPHHTDVPLKDMVDIALMGRPMAISFPAANARHGHEWKIWKEIKLPADKILIPGMLDSTSNFVEHPEYVAERIVRYAELVGRENLLVGADCGFGTFAGRLQVDSKIVWMKLKSLTAGAGIASQQLW
ncbi:MAG: cobalamin-independent methionine synthase II family protein [Chloroflexota bacterium]|nr:cobalamin-independent methionine synthase II family protein [Chloroflexota bacterium]